MEKKFKCQSCGHEFIADTSRFVTCPECQSDNVELKKSGLSLQTIIIAIVAAIIVVAGVIIVVNVIHSKENTQGGDTPDIPVETETTTDKTESQVSAAEQGGSSLVDERLIIEHETPEYDSSTKKYKVTISSRIEGTKNSEYKFEYQILNLDSTLVAENITGLFTNLAPISATQNNPNSAYIVRVIAKRTGGNPIVDTDQIHGFKPVSSVQPMTKAEVQDLINKMPDANQIGSNNRIAKRIQLISKISDYKNPETLSELFGDIKDNTIENIVVVDIAHDPNTNQLTSITFSGNKK